MIFMSCFLRGWSKEVKRIFAIEAGELLDLVKQLFTVLLNQKRVSFHQKQLMKRHPQSLRSTLFILNRPLKQDLS